MLCLTIDQLTTKVGRLRTLLPERLDVCGLRSRWGRDTLIVESWQKKVCAALNCVTKIEIFGDRGPKTSSRSARIHYHGSEI